MDAKTEQCRRCGDIVPRGTLNDELRCGPCDAEHALDMHALQQSRPSWALYPPKETTQP